MPITEGFMGNVILTLRYVLFSVSVERSYGTLRTFSFRYGKLYGSARYVTLRNAGNLAPHRGHPIHTKERIGGVATPPIVYVLCPYLF